jgi:folate-dependent phosphoribosylglycinamide formyltransferase PurN
MQKKRILFLTGSELRHKYMRYVIESDADFKVRLAICESDEKSLENRTDLSLDLSGIVRKHILDRKISEEYYFSSMLEARSPYIVVPKGDINSTNVFEIFKSSDIDLVVCFGTSILKENWFRFFPDKILNIHLGLSPYYRGSGANFWAMAHGNFACVGSTFLIMDEGIDTGKIIHQIRAEVMPKDTPHDIGNRLIAKTAGELKRVVKNFSSSLTAAEDKNFVEGRVFCKRKDFTFESVEKFYQSFDTMRDRYIQHIEEEIQKFPIHQMKE